MVTDRTSTIQTLEAKIEAQEREIERLRNIIDFIGKYESGAGMELYPCGCANVEWSEDGNHIKTYIGPWHFKYSEGDTFIEAVEKEMAKVGKL